MCVRGSDVDVEVETGVLEGGMACPWWRAFIEREVHVVGCQAGVFALYATSAVDAGELLKASRCPTGLIG